MKCIHFQYATFLFIFCFTICNPILFIISTIANFSLSASCSFYFAQELKPVGGNCSTKCFCPIMLSSCFLVMHEEAQRIFALIHMQTHNDEIVHDPSSYIHTIYTFAIIFSFCIYTPEYMHIKITKILIY